MERNEILAAILRKQPKIHCLTNPVTMNDVANILLAAGGSAVMAQDEQEAAEITTFCQGTLLNTGVPDEAKIRACILAGKRANQLGHPVVLDPVGVGGSSFRRRELRKLLDHVHPAGPLQSGRSGCTLFFSFGTGNTFFPRRRGKQPAYGCAGPDTTRADCCQTL